MEDSDDENEEAFLLDLLSGAALPEDPEGGVASTSWTPSRRRNIVDDQND